jgi:hypothetical protein
MDGIKRWKSFLGVEKIKQNWMSGTRWTGPSSHNGRPSPVQELRPYDLRSRQIGSRGKSDGRFSQQ